MPQRPGKACRVNHCPCIVKDMSNAGFCDKHKDRAGWHNNERLKGNRHARGYGSAWDKLRKNVLARGMNLCQHCKAQGKFAKATHVDHIKPKSQGGSNALTNLQALCVTCHNHKTATE